MLSDDSYRKTELEKIQGGFIKVKFTCATGETKWINVSEWEFQLLKSNLGVPGEQNDD